MQKKITAQTVIEYVYIKPEDMFSEFYNWRGCLNSSAYHMNVLSLIKSMIFCAAVRYTDIMRDPAQDLL